MAGFIHRWEYMVECCSSNEQVGGKEPHYDVSTNMLGCGTTVVGVGSLVTSGSFDLLLATIITTLYL